MIMLKELLKKTRSVRCFDRSVKISEAELYDMIECSRFCPSSANLQALKFRAVFEEEECERVFLQTKWAGYLKDEVIPQKGCEPVAYIIVCNDKSIAKNSIPFYKDTGIVSQAIMLRACEMGYGGCMIGSYNEEKVKSALGLPEELEITLILALGKAAEEPVIVESEGDIKYYRENGTHYVPKRPLSEIII